MVAENVILIVLAIILFSNSTHYDFISAAKPVSEQGDDHEGQRHFDGHSLAALHLLWASTWTGHI